MISSTLDNWCDEFVAKWDAERPSTDSSITPLDMCAVRLQSLKREKKWSDLENLLHDLVKYSSSGPETSASVRGSDVFNVVQSFMASLTMMAGVEFERLIDVCAKLVSNASGDLSQERCPAKVSFQSTASSSPSSSLVLRYCQHAGGETAWRVWDGAIILASLLFEGSEIILGESSHLLRAVELGAGTGLCGMALAISNNNKDKPLLSEVVLSDLNEHILSVIDGSVQDNADAFAEAGVIVSTRRIDWLTLGTAEDAAGPYDLVIGTDVVYDELTLDGITRVVPLLLSKNGNGRSASSRFICCCGNHRVGVTLLRARMESVGLKCVLENNDAAQLVQRQMLPVGLKPTTLFIFEWND
eukprot:PhM_4_TR16025/c0_g3_i1/m.50356